MTRWMEIAWEEVGTREIPGARAAPSIVDYFRDSGRPEITSDEVAWCAAFVGACLARAGVKPRIRPGHELLASSYLEVGTAIDTPRVGAIVCVRRNGGSGWHVAFVSGWNATHLKLLGGNQKNSVCEVWAPREGAVLRWPEEPVTPAALAKDGSRIAAGAGAAQKDGAKVTGINGAERALPAPPQSLGLEEVAAKAGSLKGSIETIEQFLLFAWGRGGWIALALTLFWCGRIVWRSGWIKWWRAEDASTGKTTA